MGDLEHSKTIKNNNNIVTDSKNNNFNISTQENKCNVTVSNNKKKSCLGDYRTRGMTRH